MLPALTLLQEHGETLYETSLREIVYGALLTAVTMVIHGYGMIQTLRVSTAFKQRFAQYRPFAVGLSSIVIASWLILFVHLLEVAVWALFFWWRGGIPNLSLAYYFALLEYTTLGSSMHLARAWRLLEGGIAIVGLLTFAWSTGVLLILAKDLQDHQMKKFEEQRRRRLQQKTPPPGDKASGA